jgi:hypothetical protein
MLSNFCPKCKKLLCACVVTASIAGALFGSQTADVQGDLPSAHLMDALGTTGTQNHVAYNAITDEEYVGFWPDQLRVAVVGPTGSEGDSPRVEVRLNGPTGPARSGTGSEVPKGPTGAGG